MAIKHLVKYYLLPGLKKKKKDLFSIRRCYNAGAQLYAQDGQVNSSAAAPAHSSKCTETDRGTRTLLGNPAKDLEGWYLDREKSRNENSSKSRPNIVRFIIN